MGQQKKHYPHSAFNLIKLTNTAPRTNTQKKVIHKHKGLWLKLLSGNNRWLWDMANGMFSLLAAATNWMPENLPS